MNRVNLTALLIALFVTTANAADDRPWRDLLKGDDLAANWRTPHGNWRLVGETVKSPGNEKRLTARPGTGVLFNGNTPTSNILTTAEHGDIEAHIEFMVPKGSNSGIYFMGRYEIQVFDSHGVQQPKHSDCGGIYERWRDNAGGDKPAGGYEGRAPKVNASLPPGEWQTFDVQFKASRFDASGKKTSNAVFLKVLHNGKVIHENQEVTGPTRAGAFNDEKPTGPIMLQGDHGPVAYRNIRVRALPASALAAAPAGSGAAAAPAPRPDTRPADPYQALLNYDFNQSRAPLSAIEEQIRKAAPPDYPAIERKLLDVIKNPSATFAARHFSLRMLSRVGSAAAVPVVAPLLADEKLSHMARYALEPIKDPSAGAALRDALRSTSGKLKIGIISSLGDRADAQAIEALTPLATDANAAVSAAAIEALGDIGTPPAVAALASIKDKVADDRKTSVAAAQVVAAKRLARAGDKPAAVRLFQSLAAPSSPEAVRGAALEGLVLNQSVDDAIMTVVATVQGNDPAAKESVLAAVSSADVSLRNAIAAQLADLPPEAQPAILPVVSAADVTELRPSLLKIVDGPARDDFKAAAVEALTNHGAAEDIPKLITLAVEGKGKVKDASRETLKRIGKPGSDEAILKTAESGQGAPRAIAVRAIVDRQMDSALPILIRIAGGSDPAAAEAASGLAVLGTVEELPLLVQIVKGGQDPARRNAADAIGKICGRAADKDACSRIIVPNLEGTADPRIKSALLKTLSRIANDQALKAAVAVAEKDPALREDAIRELAAWPNLAAAPHLLTIARGDSQKEAVLALRGYIDLAKNAKDKPASQRLEMLRTALSIAKRPEEKRQAASALAEVPSIDALESLKTLAKDPDASAEAVVAGIKLSKQIGGVYKQRALAALNDFKSAAPNDDLRKQASEAITSVEKMAGPDGYIVAWLLAGPYKQDGKSGADLFDIKFDPETDKASAVAWQPIFPADPNNRTIELDKLLGGENRAAYLKTTLTSPKAQKAELHIGTDDGVKVLFNGKTVHANNASRGITPNQDKVKIDLKEGKNDLLVKVTQGGGGWGAIVRLRSESGGELKDVSASPD